MSEEINTKKCPFCGGETNVNSEKCDICGESLLKTCPFCGEEVNIKAIKCKYCGENLNEEAVKSWEITYLLCSLFGIFGLHNFYNKKTGIGIAQLLTLGGLGIWVFIDWIMIMNDTYTDANGLKPIKKVSKVTTAFLCIYSYGIAHRFYTGNKGWLAFFIYIVCFFTTGILFVPILIPIIWTIVDFSKIIKGQYTDGQRNLIKE